MEYILEKALPVFPRLQDLDVSSMVKFYNGQQKISMQYLLPLMPFDSISLTFGFEGLCPHGLGTVRYSAIASAWMDVLPRLLPQTESMVESAIFSVSVDSNNGFDLMWRILELAVPGFKSMNPVQVLPYYQVKMAVIKNALVTRLTRPDRAHAPPHVQCELICTGANSHAPPHVRGQE